ncbi:hypothetical protein Taro_005914 [Colocasia esculenta]|uniref:Uncharacterized protein n=1 Tax=Colocasia esculenta TaxID=4460 RepID=A0A843TUF3_COLES|nr:hypothetical protein [Colocasia esculenta]
MAPSIKPEGDSGYVVFKKATYPLSQSQTEPELDAIGTMSRQSPCRDPEDGAKGPRGPGGIPALKMASGFPVKLKVQGEHVSVQSTSAEEIRQHKVYRPSTKDKYKEQARGRTPRLAKAPSNRAELREVGQNSKKRSTIPAAPSPKHM